MISQTILFKHLYQNPPEAISFAEGNKISDEALKSSLDHFYDFYEEIFIELSNLGELKELYVCDNLGDHMIGNVYAKFANEEYASRAYNTLAGKYYHSNLVQEEYSPVLNFKECRCRNYEEDRCERGGFCNFLHLKHVSSRIEKLLRDEMYEKHPEYRNKDFSSHKKKKKYRHEHSSSESSLDGYDNYHRKKIIKKWCVKYQKEKELEEKKKEAAQAKINLALIEQKLSQTTKKAEDLIQQQNPEKDFIIIGNENLNNIEIKKEENNNYVSNSIIGIKEQNEIKDETGDKNLENK